MPPRKQVMQIRTLSRMHTPILIAFALLAACAPATLPPPSKEPKPNTHTATQEKTDGFVALFDGRTLDGWMGDTVGYAVEKGAIVCQAGGTNLFTKEEFSDFELRFEFQLTAGANNGIALRCPTEGDPAYVGFESQILDNTADMYKGLKEWQYHGSIYGIAAATATALRPVGELNSETITMKGSRVTVELNGIVIVDVDLAVVAKDGVTVSGHTVEGLKRTSGHIGFCGHGDRVAYSNVRIKKL